MTTTQYTLYYLPDACSLATQVVLRELEQPVTLIHKQHAPDFDTINPVGTVPVLVGNGRTLREGAAILLALLDSHPNTLLPATGVSREQAVQDILFANATMHPAYGRLFFIAQHITDNHAKQQAFQAAANSIAALWEVVEQQLCQHADPQPFLGGEQPSAADIMLTVYSRWGASFPVTIPFGPKTQRMLEAVQALPSFQRSLAAEQAQSPQ